MSGTRASSLEPQGNALAFHDKTILWQHACFVKSKLHTEHLCAGPNLFAVSPHLDVKCPCRLHRGLRRILWKHPLPATNIYG